MTLLELRAASGWSQEFVSRQLEVSRQTIINWEKRISAPTGKNLQKIADLFGVPAEKIEI